MWTYVICGSFWCGRIKELFNVWRIHINLCHVNRLTDFEFPYSVYRFVLLNQIACAKSKQIFLFTIFTYFSSPTKPKKKRSVNCSKFKTNAGIIFVLTLVLLFFTSKTWPKKPENVTNRNEIHLQIDKDGRTAAWRWYNRKLHTQTIHTLR